MPETAKRAVPSAAPLSDIARSRLLEANRARRLATSISTPDVVASLNSYAEEQERLAGVEDRPAEDFGAGLYP